MPSTFPTLDIIHHPVTVHCIFAYAHRIACHWRLGSTPAALVAHRAQPVEQQIEFLGKWQRRSMLFLREEYRDGRQRRARGA